MICTACGTEVFARDGTYYDFTMPHFEDKKCRIKSSTFPPMVRDDSGARTYTTMDGRTYPSINAALHASMPPERRQKLDEWKARPEAAFVSRQATARGRLCHKYMEAVLLGQKRPVMPLFAKAHVEQMLKYALLPDKLVALEIPMWSDELQVAGTADCISEERRGITITDWKFLSRPPRKEYLEDYLIQGCAYAAMWNERTGTDEAVECRVCWSSENPAKAGTDAAAVKDMMPALRERLK